MAKGNKTGLLALGAVGAIAGAAAAIFMRKKENREKVGKAIVNIEKKGGELVRAAEKEVKKTVKKSAKKSSRKGRRK